MTMTSAELKCLRESMGLTTRWLAERWDVSEVSVKRWERTLCPPERIVRQITDLKRRFDEEVARGVALRGDYVCAARNDRFRDGRMMPAAWTRAVAQRVHEGSGARILFYDDEQDPYENEE